MDSKRTFLESHGWVVGERDPRINTDFAGRFMVCEPHEDRDLPTKDGSTGPWAIVGDDLSELVTDAHEHLSDLLA